jgi:hypothetical protein
MQQAHPRSLIKKPSNYCSPRFSGVNGGIAPINTNKKGANKMKQSMNATIIFLAGLVLLAGCSLKYNLNPPITSTAEYEQAAKKMNIVYVYDNRQDKKFIKGMTGLASVNLNIGNVDDPVTWLSQSLEKEFLSHNISVKFTRDDSLKSSADAILTVNKYQIINSRTSGFHPYVAYHCFSGIIKDSSADESILSYFVYGKTPVWSMDEVQAPCFDMPAAILIKEIAAKVNRFALHYRMNDSQLSKLNQNTNEKINSGASDVYLSVLEIGQSNNPKAIDYLKQFSENSDTLIRACSLSGFGMIGQKDTLDFLKDKYTRYIDIDRFMALKSIGDIGTPEAIQFLKDARKDPQYNNEYGFKFVVDLYLDSAH